MSADVPSQCFLCYTWTFLRFFFFKGFCWQKILLITNNGHIKDDHMKCEMQMFQMNERMNEWDFCDDRTNIHVVSDSSACLINASSHPSPAGNRKKKCIVLIHRNLSCSAWWVFTVQLLLAARTETISRLGQKRGRGWSRVESPHAADYLWKQEALSPSCLSIFLICFPEGDPTFCPPAACFGVQLTLFPGKHDILPVCRVEFPHMSPSPRVKATFF